MMTNRFIFLSPRQTLRCHCRWSSTKTISTSLVSSKLDYCNSILYNSKNCEINKLQNVQNCLARVVTRSPRFFSVTPLLKSLHWLPVQFRVKDKICTLTYKVIHQCQPVYLHNLLKPLNRTRNLRSGLRMMINWLFPEWVLRFSVAAPSSGIVSLLWLKNLNLHSHFGKKLKTYYISAKPFHPKSSVPRHAGFTNWNGNGNDNEPDSDLQRWFGFSFHFHFIRCIFKLQL